MGMRVETNDAMAETYLTVVPFVCLGSNLIILSLHAAPLSRELKEGMCVAKLSGLMKPELG